MSQALPLRFRQALEARIAEATGRPSAVAASRPVGGGCIHDARILELEDGRSFFVKSNASPLPGIFEAEAAGLRALESAAVIRVPRGAFWGGGSGGAPAFLVMEAITPGRPRADFSEVFGRRFARLHRETRAQRYGFEGDNYLGATPQPNGWMDDWVEFWRERRLGDLLAQIRNAGLGDGELDRLGDRLLDRLDDFLAEPEEPPCLLHGDLWGGNYLVHEAGEPVLVDPAAYYGRREADLALPHLFGGFDERFHAAYEEEWPLEPGSTERLEIYKLHHLLNHLLLFGGSYRGVCLAILRRLV